MALGKPGIQAANLGFEIFEIKCTKSQETESEASRASGAQERWSETSAMRRRQAKALRLRAAKLLVGFNLTNEV